MNHTTPNPFYIISLFYNGLMHKIADAATNDKHQLAKMFELVLFCIYSFFCLATIHAWYDVLSIRRLWMKLWGGVDYQLQQNSWANLKEMLAAKMNGKTIEKNKKEIFDVVTNLRRHPLYRKYSVYNYQLAQLLHEMEQTSTFSEFNKVQNRLVNAFAHGHWPIREQFYCFLNISTPPIAMTVSFVCLHLTISNMHGQ
jgi:hypothetical protein